MYTQITASAWYRLSETREEKSYCASSVPGVSMMVTFLRNSLGREISSLVTGSPALASTSCRAARFSSRSSRASCLLPLSTARF